MQNIAAAAAVVIVVVVVSAIQINRRNCNKSEFNFIEFTLFFVQMNTDLI